MNELGPFEKGVETSDTGLDSISHLRSDCQFDLVMPSGRKFRI